MGDYSQTASAVIPSSGAVIVKRRAQATIVGGQPVYKYTATTVSPADANASAATAKVFGLALNSAAAGQWVWIVTRDPLLGIGITLAIGDILILSANAGGIAPAADLATGWHCTVLGIAVSTTVINFAPIAAGAPKA